MEEPGNRPYFLRSARLGWGEWTREDGPLAMALWGDARVTQWIGGPFSNQQVRDRLAAEIATQEACGVSYWPLFRRSDHAHVGCCGLRPLTSEPPGAPERMVAAAADRGVRDEDDGPPSLLELGFHVRFEHWRQGYALESARAVIEHAFGALGVRALFAGHHPHNEASRALLGRLGFRYTHDALYAPTGLMHPSYLLTSGAPNR